MVPVRRLLQRQVSVMEGDAINSSQSIDIEMNDSAVRSLEKLRRGLNFEEEEMVEEEEEEEVHVMEDEDINIGDDTRLLLCPLGPVLMLIKAIRTHICMLTIELCEGCQNGYGSQKDHACIWHEWEEQVELYFDRALEEVTENYFFTFFESVYALNSMAHMKRMEITTRATKFFKNDFPKKEVREYVKSRIIEEQ